MGCGEHYAASALWVCGECEYALGRGGTILCADTVNTLTAIHHSATWLKYHCPTHIWFESLHHTKTNEISKTIQKHFSLLSRHFPCNLHLTPGHGNVLTYNLGLWILILKPKQKRALKRGHFFSRNRMCSNLQCNRSSLPNTVFISTNSKNTSSAERNYCLSFCYSSIDIIFVYSTILHSFFGLLYIHDIKSNVLGYKLEVCNLMRVFIKGGQKRIYLYIYIISLNIALLERGYVAPSSELIYTSWLTAQETSKRLRRSNLHTKEKDLVFLSLENKS